MRKSLSEIKKLRVSFAVILLILLAACEYEQREPVDLTELPEVVSFTNDIIPVFDAKCTQCHDGATPPDLTAEFAYTDLQSGNFLNTESPEESEFYKTISGSGSMAQYASDLDRALILKWIEQGAEEN